MELERPVNWRMIVTLVIGSIAVILLVPFLGFWTSLLNDVPMLIAFIPVWLAGFFLYMIPSVIAYSRRHPQRVPLLIVNLLLGWTMAGWAVALAWSLWSYQKN